MEQGPELGPSYKSLFLGACVVIGGAFGWWLTHFVSAVDQFKRDVASMESELRQESAKLAARVAELEWRQQLETTKGRTR